MPVAQAESGSWGQSGGKTSNGSCTYHLGGEKDLNQEDTYSKIKLLL